MIGREGGGHALLSIIVDSYVFDEYNIIHNYDTVSYIRGLERARI